MIPAGLLLSLRPALGEGLLITPAPAVWSNRPALALTFTLPPGLHLSEGFLVTAGTPPLPLEPLSLPSPDLVIPLPAYAASFQALYPFPPAFPLTITHQTCDDSTCHFPETTTFNSLDFAAAETANSTATTTDETDANEVTSTAFHSRIGYVDVPDFLAFLDQAQSPAEPSSADPISLSAWRRFLADPAVFLQHQGLPLTLLLILLGGILLNLTPCVLPLIPVNLALIGAGASSTAPRSARFRLGLAYGLGMALAYGGLGLIVILTGGVFGSLNASPIFNLAVALLFVALALAMFDVWQLDFSRFRKAGAPAARAPLPAAVLMGALSAILAGACVAPVLVAVLALSAGLYAAGTPGALLLPFLLGLGMALPWPLLAAGWTILPRPGAWMLHVKKIFGVLILVLAAWYALQAFRAFRASAGTAADAPPPPGFTRLDLANPDTPAALQTVLQNARRDHRPVLLDFGARWCKVCHLMDSTTLRDPAITARLDGFTALQILADDPSSPAVAAILAAYRVQGFPSYILLPAHP